MEFSLAKILTLWDKQHIWEPYSVICYTSIPAKKQVESGEGFDLSAR